MRKEAGFTLIELIMVIVILAVLAVTALPKFFNLKTDAEASALAGVAGSLSAASSINYAARSLSTANGTAIGSCQAVANALVEGALPSGYSISTLTLTISDGSTKSCKLTGPNGTAHFTAIKTS
ncbi:Type II secretion system protein [Gammaproteobacteria bacterium]